MIEDDGTTVAVDIQKVADMFVPVGTIVAWYFELDKVPIPKGWALCTGQIVNNITTPDLRGKSIMMPSNGKPCNYPTDNSTTCLNLGQFAGEQSHILSIAEMPNHNHNVISCSMNDNNGTNNLAGGDDNRGCNWGTGGRIEATGGNAPHNIVHPVLGVNYIMKVRSTIVF